jgi:predicted RNase H-like nuclease (RuvC/YqgF family)
MAMDLEAEIRDLKRRVSELEGSFGFLTRQVQGVHKDLLRFEEKTDAKLREHDERFANIDRRFDRLEHKVDGLDGKIDSTVSGLRRDLPKIVGDTMREVLREGREHKR